MEHNKWETAVGCLEAALRPGARADEVMAAIDAFRRRALGVPLSQVCLEFACGGVSLAALGEMKATLDRVGEENLELRRKLAVESAAQSEAAQRLDGAYRRIYELTEEAAAAQRLAETALREFDDFRAAYAEVVAAAQHGKRGAPATLDDVRANVVEIAPLQARRPFNAFLAEARLAADLAAAELGAGNGSGKVTAGVQAPEAP